MVAAVLALTGTAHVIPLDLAGAMAQVLVVFNLPDAIDPLPPCLAQRSENCLIFYESTGGVIFLSVLRKLVGNFFVRKLVGVRVGWIIAPLTAIRRQGRADRFFVFLILVTVVVGVVSVRLCLRVRIGCKVPGDFVVQLKAIIVDRRFHVDWNIPAVVPSIILRFLAKAVWMRPSTVVAELESAPASAKEKKSVSIIEVGVFFVNRVEYSRHVRTPVHALANHSTPRACLPSLLLGLLELVTHRRIRYTVAVVGGSLARDASHLLARGARRSPGIG